MIWRRRVSSWIKHHEQYDKNSQSNYNLWDVSLNEVHGYGSLIMVLKKQAGRLCSQGVIFRRRGDGLVGGSLGCIRGWLLCGW